MNQTESVSRPFFDTPILARVFINKLSAIRIGHLQLITPHGTSISFGNSQEMPGAALHIMDWRACAKIMLSGDIGLAESVERGWIESPDMVALIRLAIRNQTYLQHLVDGNLLSKIWYRIKHVLRSNTRAGSRKNIHAHYDIGNPFYKLWLDQTMTYSAGIFEGNLGLSLEQAQRNKYGRIVDQLGLQAGDHVLEIGCGWGGFAHFAAARGIKVTGLTLSSAQLDYAKEKNLPFADLVDLQLCDYRDMQGTFDAVVSIEMFEAVGEKFWKGYFDVLNQRIKSGGAALIQSITINDADFEKYRSGTDFIQQVIFPGGMLPSPERFVELASRRGLVTEQQFRFGPDYAETLRRWRKNYRDHLADCEQLGYDQRFQRIWELYFSYCEAGFDEGKTDVVQFTLRKT